MGTEKVVFECADVALLRATTRPLVCALQNDAQAHATPPADPYGEDWLRQVIARIAAEPLLMEAVSLASKSLADDVAKAVAGEPVKPRKLRRIATALTKYHLRMTYRATPFGLFAGVTLAELGAAPVRRLGTGHRSVSRPDAGWLEGVVAGLIESPELLERSRLVANDLHVVRDGRLVLVDFHASDGERQLTRSVRCTAVVRRTMQIAAQPVAWSELVGLLERRFPAAPPGGVKHMLVQLVRGRFLISDLAPPPDCTDPLGYLRTRLHGVSHPTVDALDDIRAALAGLDAAPPAGRSTVLAAVTARMRALRPTTDTIQVDTALDARLVLPEEVGREVERAAAALWRTAPADAGMRHLRDYHRDFVERYGTERAVPVMELLDEARGLGLPGAYRRPPGSGVGARPAGERDRVLGELLLSATRQGARELALDQAALKALSGERFGEPPRSMEIGVELLADSWAALCAGEFQLALGTQPISPLAGATFSRFAPALGDDARKVGELARRVQDASELHLLACVAYRPRVVRSANLSTIPAWLPHRIPLGVSPAASQEVRDLCLAELAIQADERFLRLVHTPTGRRVLPLSFSMLNPASGHVPHVARFLLELSHEGRHFIGPWHWGAWATLPALPRVRHGRTVLAPARWLPDRDLRAAVGRPDPEWSAQVGAWRKRWDVPRHVRLTKLDHCVEVDLQDLMHQVVFHDELKRHPDLLVQERIAGETGREWFAGTDGPHACELIFPVFAKPQTRKPQTGGQIPTSTTRPVPTRVPAARGHVTAASHHLPGGEWLYAKVYVPQALQADVLARHAARLTDPRLLHSAGVDTWFFIRYSDPEPHLRFRFHGRPETLWSVLLPALHSWTAKLRAAGLVARLALDTYVPETERYGGLGALGHAERVFHADSALVLAQLAEAHGGIAKLPATSAAALGVLHSLTAFGTPDEVVDWLNAPRIMARRAEVAREDKDAVAALLDDQGRPRPAGEQIALGELWSVRETALRALQEALTAEGDGPDRRYQVAGSLAHMHCNRLLGTDREREVLVNVMAREGLALWRDRRRHLG